MSHATYLTRNVQDLVSSPAKGIFETFFMGLVNSTYQKMYSMATRMKLESKFRKITENIDLNQVKEDIYNIADEMPPRLSIYDINVYVTEIWSLIFGKYLPKFKDLTDYMIEHAKRKEIMEFYLSKWNDMENKIDNLINDAVRVLLTDTELSEEERYRLLTYITGLSILHKVVREFSEGSMRSTDPNNNILFISKVLILGLLTSRYMEGKMSAEDYLYNMEYLGEIFIKESREITDNPDEDEHLQYVFR